MKIEPQPGSLNDLRDKLNALRQLLCSLPINSEEFAIKSKELFNVSIQLIEAKEQLKYNQQPLH